MAENNMNELNEKELEQVAGGKDELGGLNWYHTFGQQVTILTKVSNGIGASASVVGKGYYTVNDKNVAVIYLITKQNQNWIGWYAEKNSTSFNCEDKLNVSVTEVKW